VVGLWRELHYKELHNLYVLFAKCNQNNQVRKDEMGRSSSTHGGEEECI
jgi:hypothetical protein